MFFMVDSCGYRQTEKERKYVAIMFIFFYVRKSHKKNRLIYITAQSHITQPLC